MTDKRRPPHTVIVKSDKDARFAQDVVVGPHRLRADEPEALGGNDSGPTPYDLLLAALGSCTAITIRMYAERKGWPLEGVTVTLRHEKIHAEDCADCETRTGLIDRIDKTIALEGPLDEGQRTHLLEIAGKCPVNRTLKSEVAIYDRLAEATAEAG